MLRRIVLIRHHETLEKGWQERSFGPAGSSLARRLTVPGMELDETYHPVRVVSQLAAAQDRPEALGFDYGALRSTPTFSVRSDFDDEEAIARLKADRPREVIGVFADPAISVFPTPYCKEQAVGTVRNVEQRLGVAALRKAGLTGKGVRVAIVDTGIHGDQIPVSGGWGPTPGYVPGSALPGHGTMVAFDVKIAAPEARLYDYALLKSGAGPWAAFLSDAISAYADLIDLITRQPGTLIVNNSWGLYDRSEDAPIGSPENYSANPDHPFNQIVGGLAAAGADIFFAAGNCGGECPADRCGENDRGPGRSIHGANSHPDVITVAAVTVNRQRLGYSSQGPGGLHQRKPDLAAYSHFKGSGVYDVDSGTSAACPVAAGVAAALRQKVTLKKLQPAQLKGLLQRTAHDLEHVGWDYNTGYGVINAGAVIKALGTLMPSKRKTAKK